MASRECVEQNLVGWSANLLKVYNEQTGGMEVRFHGLLKDYVFEVFFSIGNLYIDGQQCPSWGEVLSYISIGDLLHFDAERFDIPAYEYGDDVWYQATCVWVGPAPTISHSEQTSEGDSEESEEDSDSDDESDVNNCPDVHCQPGKVKKFVNKNLALMESTINGYKTLVALERCRFYFNGQECSTLEDEVDVGEVVLFEGYRLDEVHPCGVAYRVSLAWQGRRPNLDLLRPTHALQLLAVQPARPAVAVSTGVVVALATAAVAVIKTTIDQETVLMAVERCRFYDGGVRHAKEKDISNTLKLGGTVKFSGGYKLSEPFVCGVSHRASVAWIGQQPSKIPTGRLTHALVLPQQLLIDVNQALQCGILK